MPSIKPLADRVLLKVLEQEEKTSSGILLPDTAKEKTQKAEVVEVGDSEDIKVKKGDIVIYDKYAGIQIKEGDTEYLIVKNEEIVALIK
ncbi:co-chaperone GroES [Brachyspira hyodysenteriae]|uniref:Co-chaperonin GroES n=2 Tax=Brachyspira hyodysenteriae TaxID=159 RepID=A0A3B6VH36_BRAHW|nr:co-chaperone GroES [Brachyspira hyodysenteriae]ACN84514.1 co-chaperonin GroES [Brachyspira hyodysenteriae WA1]ANN63406.1 co-chaperone GroES [Brachyspira hyodysenteriae ATCC 27164]AUJ50247.1 molecular chaperone GroES [Brachyspira hyodysenteriae]KLI17144.1 molecular chaperone GroES [Brachyspira hyodysenteriae]KLI19015.1 molecular chaperone GroES [Brachyspira hyodysenteriae]